MNFTIPQPDDWHVHLRDGAALKHTVAASAKQFHRVLVMPNLTVPIVTTAQALDYRQRILAHCPVERPHFMPLMSLYLTEETEPEEIKRAQSTHVIPAVKYYPAGATTNSHSGVRDIQRVYSVLEMMEKMGLLLLVHGEVTDPNIDIFDREAVFIDRMLKPIIARFPSLKIVMEHITTKEAVAFIQEQKSNIAATITPQHLLYNRNAIFKGGIQPHMYCLPILKREGSRLALLKAATSGSPHFFLGTDSAPHVQEKKENACGCAGIFSAPIAMELYATAFNEVGALDKLAGFASHYGADFYGVPRNTNECQLVAADLHVPEHYDLGDGKVVPIQAGKVLRWVLTYNQK